jgi:hypothetical protein
MLLSFLVSGVALSSCLTPPGARPAGALASAPPALPRTDAGKPSAVPGLPNAFVWAATAPLIVPRSDPKHDLVAVKDPMVVRFNDRWHVYASSVGRGGIYGMVYTSFADWKDAPSAPLYYMRSTEAPRAALLPVMDRGKSGRPVDAAA